MKKLYPEESIQAIADAIRAKTGKTDKMKISDMAANIQDISASSSSSSNNLDKYLAGSMTKIESGAKTICANAIAYHTEVKEVSFPNAVSIGDDAFNKCTALTTIYAPLATSTGTQSYPDNLESITIGSTEVSSSLFRYYAYLKSASFPNATTIGQYAFQTCSALKEIYFPSVITIDKKVFGGCSSLLDASFPNVTEIYSDSFASCTSLTSVDFPKVITIDSDAFYNCTSLTSVIFPKVTTISSYAFSYCTALIKASFPNAESISTYVFQYCSNLKAIVLSSSSLCTLSNYKAFQSSGVASGTGYIYVPKALVEEYKSATNWSTFTTQFRALEDYTVDGTSTGELDESKI